MGHFINASELAELCAAVSEETGDPRTRDIMLAAEATLIAAAVTAGKALADHFGVEFLGADNQPGFAGLCANFGPKKEGDKCPPDLAFYDTGSDWAQETQNKTEEVKP